jgi:hypothetical protein
MYGCGINYAARRRCSDRGARGRNKGIRKKTDGLVEERRNEEDTGRLNDKGF